MKIKILIAIVSLALPLMGMAQGLTASKCLTEVPARVLPLLDKNTRLDMIDYFSAGMTGKSVSQLGGACTIIELGDSSVTFMLSDSIRCQMFVLNPNAPAPVIAMITTYSKPLQDSKVELFTTRWEPQPQLLAQPTLKDWLTPEGAKARVQVEEEIPFILATAVFDPKTQTLQITNQTESYFVDTDQPAALQMLRPQLTYQWDGKKFKLAK